MQVFQQQVSHGMAMLRLPRCIFAMRGAVKLLVGPLLLDPFYSRFTLPLKKLARWVVTTRLRTIA